MFFRYFIKNTFKFKQLFLSVDNLSPADESSGYKYTIFPDSALT
ncbi:hypothetical protein F385_1532 [Pantoea agglomerans 299R]|nr:hypothetical protein F385_1532 [Pantoea agglomerans 299R]